MTVGDVLTKAIDLLRARKIASAKLDAEILVSQALGWERTDLYTNSFQVLEKDELVKCMDWLERRQSGEPVAYILGIKGFYKHDFIVSPDVLIPRPETELVVETALDYLLSFDTQTPKIVDLGAGSGCIGLSLLTEIPSSRLLAVDHSLSALEVLRLNSEKLGVDGRTSVWSGDAGSLSPQILRETLGDLADVIVANPPYVRADDPDLDENVRKFEPHTALFGGSDGLEAVRSWAQACQSLLKKSGLCVFEIGSTQGRDAKEIFNSLPQFEDVAVIKDLAGLDRVVSARLRQNG